MGPELNRNTPDGASPDPDCCAQDHLQRSRELIEKPNRFGIGAALAAIGTAAISSACCWLPLLLVALGVSAVGVGALFESLRVPFLLLSLLSLGFGFYWVFFRNTVWVSGEAFASPDSAVSRRNKLLLWIALVFVAAFALFPEYVSVLVTPSPISSKPLASDSTMVVYMVKGMSCGGCESHAKKALEAIDGVRSAEVSYDEGVARVTWFVPPDDEKVVVALDKLGYEAFKKSGP